MYSQFNEDAYNVAAARDSAERQLWCAVIGRALNDALHTVGAATGEVQRDRIRDEAREWFLRNGGDFRAACESAGYDPDYLRHRFLKLMDDGAQLAP